MLIPGGRSIESRYLHITSRLLIGMGKNLKPVELCLHTLAHKHNRELIRSMHRPYGTPQQQPSQVGVVVFLFWFYWHEG